MSNQEQSGKSGLVFGARNLGGAIIDTLIADGWAMAGVARSTATLEKITRAGALALEADVTDQASVTRALGRATEANGRIDLVVNAASAYGGTRTGPFGGGPSRRRAQTRSTRGPPRRLAPRSHSSPARELPRRAGRPRNDHPGDGRLSAARDARPGTVGGGRIRGPRNHTSRGARVAPTRHPCRAAIVDAGIEPVSGEPRQASRRRPSPTPAIADAVPLSRQPRNSGRDP